MTTQTFKYYHDLPPWAKGVVVIIGVGSLVYAGVLIRNGIRKAVDHGKEAKSVKDAQADLAELKSQGMKQTYQDGQYTAWADKIEVQFSGCDYSMGQDVIGLTLTASGKTLSDIVKLLKNDVDFLKLVSAYGVRTYDQCGTWPFSGNFTGSLFQAVSDELDEIEIKSINEQLQKQGITKNF
jgi:hypothetical protein